MGSEKILRPMSTYDNVTYDPEEVPSWQYYRCFSIIIKVVEVVFSVLTFIFAVLWTRAREHHPLVEPAIEGFPWFSTPGIYVALLAFFTAVLSTALLFVFICCAMRLTNRLGSWFRMEFFLGIAILILYFIGSLLSLVYAVIYPQTFIITTCVFTFLTQMVYGMDNGMQFVYWRENKRRSVWKHSVFDE